MGNETPRFSKVFHQMSKLQRKEYDRMLRVCRNARRHESSFPSKEAQAQVAQASGSSATEVADA